MCDYSLRGKHIQLGRPNWICDYLYISSEEGEKGEAPEAGEEYVRKGHQQGWPKHQFRLLGSTDPLSSAVQSSNFAR